MTEPILLFLDINGVIDVEKNVKTLGEKLPNDDSIVYPVPGAKEFLKVIDSSTWIRPMWISSWGCQSKTWNKWSKTRPWSVAYPLNRTQASKALKLFPDEDENSKYLAARWHSRDWSHRIVWIEDGFWSMQAALNWAKSNSQIQLIDTLPIPKERPKGFEVGIGQWNIQQICDALNIRQNREVLLNKIGVSAPHHSGLSDREITFSEKETQKPKNLMLSIPKIFNPFRRKI